MSVHPLLQRYYSLCCLGSSLSLSETITILYVGGPLHCVNSSERFSPLKSSTVCVCVWEITKFCSERAHDRPVNHGRRPIPTLKQERVTPNPHRHQRRRVNKKADKKRILSGGENKSMTRRCTGYHDLWDAERINSPFPCLKVCAHGMGTRAKGSATPPLCVACHRRRST